MGKSKEIVKKDLDGNVVEVYTSSREWSKRTGKPHSLLYALIRRKKVYEGFTYEYSGNFSDEKPIYENGFKCPYCEEVLKNYNGLAKHVMHKHPEISKEQLLADYYYGGIRPTCKCGCGEYTNITYDRNNNNQIKFADFCHGHHSRVHNNWGHNEEAKKNSAETRRQQYASGERTQWNKGKMWDETYSKEMQEKLLSVIQSKERRRKISCSLTGVPKTENHILRLKEIRNTPEMREVYRKNLLKRINSGKFSLASKLETDFIEDFIKPLNLEFQTQYYIKDIHQYCDIYIPSKNLIIEVDGSFWHCDPRLFPNGPKFDYQKRKIKLDEEKNQYCKDHNIKLLRVWEMDILKSPEEVTKILEKELLT